MASKALAIIAGVGPGTTYSVVLLSRNPDNYEPIVKEINAGGGKAIGISADVSDANSVKAAFAQIEKEFPGTAAGAAVFNPSGGFVKKPFLELTDEQFSTAIDSQAKGGFYFAKHTLPSFSRARAKHPIPDLDLYWRDG
ncbi:hypothetical protein N7470_008610 [Penicillium chermesinum]|nr:hypothetical protein N7470_008610 [Penicillium chermesinum]